jgi:hypothetical protein
VDSGLNDLRSDQVGFADLAVPATFFASAVRHAGIVRPGRS